MLVIFCLQYNIRNYRTRLTLFMVVQVKKRNTGAVCGVPDVTRRINEKQHEVVRNGPKWKQRYLTPEDD